MIKHWINGREVESKDVFENYNPATGEAESARSPAAARRKSTRRWRRPAKPSRNGPIPRPRSARA